MSVTTPRPPALRVRSGSGRAAALLLIVLAWVSPASAEFTAKVVAVPEGELLTVEQGTRRQSIRLHGVECSDRQGLAVQARRYLSMLSLGKDVVIVPVGEDGQGRVVADVFLPDGQMLNARLIGAGLAWTDGTSYGMFSGLEDEARAAHRGIWQEVPPKGSGRYPSRRGTARR